MKLNQFDRLTQTLIGPVLGSGGFSYDRGTFFRELDVGIRHVVSLDFDMRGKKTYRVIVGFHSPLLPQGRSPSDDGVFGVRYLAGGGLRLSPANFPCFTEEAARASLLDVAAALRNLVVPWFDEVRSLGDLAEITEEHFPFFKGKLFLLAGNRQSAKHYLSIHLTTLSAQPPTQDTRRAIDQTRELIEQC
ncbi:hypothetical protein [Ideonella sp. BN130291]|uniref:hypothetical protein n=1 Tax=Ideonella sp. BN130291 TaxID=3112940 RepID=UPI002E263DF5|nr:hypothetical protein [Ideonella sp. BN130291]